MTKKDIQHVRTDYIQGTLNDHEVPDSPFELFDAWLQEAADRVEKDHNAMVVSTIGEEGPDSRILLLKGYDENGLLFYTSYLSKKGRDIESSAQVALNFFWPSLERQIRVQGNAEILEEEKSIAYFNTRPRNSQLGAWASSQSEMIAKREDLEEALKEVEQRFEGKPIPKPEGWGGYLVKPSRFEFWQGRSARLHDRFQYQFKDNSWLRSRLQP